jgi:hypothetical protein
MSNSRKARSSKHLAFLKRPILAFARMQRALTRLSNETIRPADHRRRRHRLLHRARRGNARAESGAGRGARFRRRHQPPTIPSWRMAGCAICAIWKSGWCARACANGAICSASRRIWCARCPSCCRSITACGERLTLSAGLTLYDLLSLTATGARTIRRRRCRAIAGSVAWAGAGARAGAGRPRLFRRFRISRRPDVCARAHRAGMSDRCRRPWRGHRQSSGGGQAADAGQAGEGCSVRDAMTARFRHPRQN